MLSNALAKSMYNELIVGPFKGKHKWENKSKIPERNHCVAGAALFTFLKANNYSTNCVMVIINEAKKPKILQNVKYFWDSLNAEGLYNCMIDTEFTAMLRWGGVQNVLILDSGGFAKGRVCLHLVFC